MKRQILFSFLIFIIETEAICKNISTTSVLCDSPKDLRFQQNADEWKEITFKTKSDEEETIQTGFLHNVPNVNKLKFSNNINNIESNAFKGARHLQLLLFTNCNLPKIKHNWFNNTPINILVIKKCQVTKLDPKCLDNTPKLKNVAIEANSIFRIRAGVFSYSNIEILYLNDNQIEIIEEDAFKEMKNLKKLGLEKNSLTSFEPEKYIGSTSPKMYMLWLSENKIKRITKNTFEFFPKLRILLLQFNDMESIEKGAFLGANQLSYLDISNNKLTYLSSKIFPFQGLKYMDILFIHNNRLSFISTNIISSSKFPRLTKITIGGNPWQCACYRELIKYIYDRRDDVKIVCDDMEYFNGKRPVCVVPRENERHCVHNSSITSEMYKEFIKTKDMYDRLPPLCKIECSDTKHYPCYAHTFSNLLYNEET